MKILDSSPVIAFYTELNEPDMLHKFIELGYELRIPRSVSIEFMYENNIDGGIIFLKQYIPVKYEMTGGPRRREVPEVPYDALREAVINAVAHRDYFEKGANVMVEMFDDRIEITSYGGLVKSLKPEDFGKKSVLRNPNIANLLQ